MIGRQEVQFCCASCNAKEFSSRRSCHSTNQAFEDRLDKAWTDQQLMFHYKKTLYYNLDTEDFIHAPSKLRAWSLSEMLDFMKPRGLWVSNL